MAVLTIATGHGAATAADYAWRFEVVELLSTPCCVPTVAPDAAKVDATNRTVLAWRERAALMYSLVQSCQLTGAPPFEYLKDVLIRVATHPQRRIAELTPKGWAATFAGHLAAA